MCPTTSATFDDRREAVAVRPYRERMPDELPAVTLSNPPERLLRVANPTMKVLLHTPLVGVKFRDKNRIPTVEEFAEAVARERFAAIRLTPTG